MTRLGDVLEEVKRPVEVDPTKEYREIGIRSHGKGIFHKDPILGFGLGKKKIFRILPGDFVLNIVFAWEGAVAIAGPSEDGFVGSHRFPTFVPKGDELDLRFLLYYLRTPRGLGALGAVSPGGAGRNRTLNRKRFLEIEIPLPPIEDQKRIVAKLDSGILLLQEAIGLRIIVNSDLEAFVVGEELRIWPDDQLQDCPTLAKVTTFLGRGRQSRQGHSEHYLYKTQHVQMGRLIRSKMTLSPEVAQLVKGEAKLKPQDILIACSAAGCLGRVARFDDTTISEASTDTHVAIARPNERRVLPEYLFYYLLGAQGQRQLRSRERGDWKREKVGFRLTELNLKDLRQVPVPLPSFSHQREIVERAVELRRRVGEIQRSLQDGADEVASMQGVLTNSCFNG